jgi:glycosyltransferase involved in cell wall biosynthesis
LIYSDVYSVTSKADELYLKKYFITKKIAIMPNWVLDVKRNEFKNRHKNRLLAVGRLESQKNFHSLINALAGSEVELDIVGVGSEKNSLKSLALQSNVKLNLIGNLEHQELTKLYLNYRVFIIPSKFEGNPKVVLEAISRGALVISKENKNISEIINDEINGVIYKDDNEILEKVNYYLGNEKVWNEIVFEAYKSLISNNIIEKYIEREISTYKNLI